MAKLRYIYHKTSKDALKNIIKSKYLYNQDDRKKFNITNIGEGNSNRSIADSDISLKYELYWHEYNEAKGVYFRPYLNDIKLKNDNECIIVLDFEKLYKNNFTFLINTKENNGFYFTKPGYEASSPFSGDNGISYDKSNFEECELEELYVGSEIIIKESIYISPYLVCIK